jgi:Response regulator containing a CheY-like receiver domain and an HTH DNA-binding domain
MDVTDFVYQSNSATSCNELRVLLSLFLGDFGLDRFIMWRLLYASLEDREKSLAELHNLPSAWMDRYVERHYMAHDPVYLECLRATKPFLWEEALRKSDSDIARRVMAEAADYGLKSGVALSIHGPRGDAVGFSFASSSEHFRAGANELSLLNICLFQFYLAYARLAAPETRTEAQLSARELETIYWLSCGKSKAEIAEIMGVTESSIKRHCENIFAKLEVNTVASAVAKAMRLGLLGPTYDLQ